MRSSVWLLLLFLIPVPLPAQEAITPKSSPLAVIAVRFKENYLKVTYSQPHKRGRTVFGTLVPYGEIWRTGANEATELTTTKDILVNGQLLKAGTYSIFTIPDREKWTIVINSEVGLWGSYNYNQKLDVLRTDVPVTKIDNVVYEPFTMKFDHNNEDVSLQIFWDDVSVSVPLKFIY